MKSNICKIEKDEKTLDRIFKECEKVAVYNELGPKQSLQLRLLCEELVNMLPSILSNFSGEFWIENSENSYEIYLSVNVENMDVATRERLIKVSKNNKNSSVVGITGKIRAVFDYMAMGSNAPAMTPAGRYGFSSTTDFSQIWSLRLYRESLEQEVVRKPEVWDEFERSIIVNVADDVIVGVKGNNVNIIIKKNFA